MFEDEFIPLISLSPHFSSTLLYFSLLLLPTSPSSFFSLISPSSSSYFYLSLSFFLYCSLNLWVLFFYENHWDFWFLVFYSRIFWKYMILRFWWFRCIILKLILLKCWNFETNLAEEVHEFWNWYCISAWILKLIL